MALGAALVSSAIAFFIFSPLQNTISATGFSCSSGQFECSNQRCIVSNWRCDNQDDCGDNSDEVGCGFSCSSGQFECSNQRCIVSNWRCDNQDDCGDNSDEVGCGKLSLQNMIECYRRTAVNSPIKPFVADMPQITQQSHAIIPYSLFSTLRRTQSNMALGAALVSSAIAFFIFSPLQNTISATGFSCSSGQFECSNQRCIVSNWRCDNQDDCGDNSDEVGCAPRPCNGTDEFKCSNNECVLQSDVCDGINDCTDGSDEATDIITHATPPPLKCRRDEWMCADKKHCIHRQWICDGSQECDDGSDEASCGTVGCASDEFTCDNERCIPSSQRCNGVDNCNDGSDERSCPSPTPTVSATSTQPSRSAAPTLRPTNATQTPSSCEAGYFFCSSSATCVTKNKVCDGNADCSNGEDEENCGGCKSYNGHCLQQCHETMSGHYCSCNVGYKLMDDKKSCEDINECEIPGICSQVCRNTKGSFKCSCLEGYVLDLDGRKCRSSEPRASLIFSNGRDIRQISTDGSEYKKTVPDLKNAGSLDFDFKTSTIYWLETREKKVQRARIGQNIAPKVDNVLENGMPCATKIAVDWVGRKMYWACRGAIEVSQMDGSLRRTLLKGDILKPSAIALDPSERRLYWTDWSDPAKIERASMDGSEREVLISGLHLEMPVDLTIDYTNKKLYWVDFKLRVIKQCDLDGKNVREIVTRGIKKPSALTLFEDHVYWIDDKKIYKANKFTGKNVSVMVNEAFAPTDLRIYHPQRQPMGN
ncbi:PREDICTED: low-density lipoprotein receptor-related protein 4-like [Acropora digitifera]|uniref:low-density lipoprotein receptor-related protein 4-like n=1 Tax=Acropora digitifera TaxID=70779 RepID=UPI00077AD6BB|nr:PREDICTED: low-density lipoprotein receptor-related protein 4-like [Acropora digitifera]